MSGQTKHDGRTETGPKARSGRRRGVLRRPVRDLTAGRVLGGGRLSDAGRLPRYALIFVLAVLAIWGPIAAYLKLAPPRFASEAALILPGSGASASVNLNDIGQVSSQAASPFASSSISPTVTYKRLIGADRTLRAAAARMGLPVGEFGAPRVTLIDQTGLIRIAMVAGNPEDAQARTEALIAAFFDGLDRLRRDELAQREDAARGALDLYQDSVAATRREIEALQRQSGLISPDQYTALVAETGALAQRLGQLETALEERRVAASHLEAALGLPPAMAAATLKLHADTEFASLTASLSALAAELADLEGRFGARHPQVAERRDALATLRARALDRAVAVTALDRNAAAALDLSPIGTRADLLAKLVEMATEVQALEAETAALAARHARQTALVTDMIDPAARLEDLQRNFRVAETVLASAVARNETSRTDLYASYPLVQVLEAPNRPQGQSAPRVALALAAGGAATFMVLTGMALAWIRRAMIDRLLARGTPKRSAAPSPGFAMAALA